MVSPPNDVTDFYLNYHHRHRYHDSLIDVNQHSLLIDVNQYYSLLTWIMKNDSPWTVIFYPLMMDVDHHSHPYLIHIPVRQLIHHVLNTGTVYVPPMLDVEVLYLLRNPLMVACTLDPQMFDVLIMIYHTVHDMLLLSILLLDLLFRFVSFYHSHSRSHSLELISLLYDQQ